ncbi:efflux RND transporter permease subunit [Pseudogemmobacter faecipullorum]|uniref:Efflux RND transporter permease subunit n=1 Tax=Pseudogemmobacter faecipullorum TaxID=2755041 RepID=A0ABS8CIV2_9RHOB|nr:efflux RND transporter permease subunit [Pseudogemmobacter faecipullorum]MCB5409329.1 efflux RND transporter permease subunit [Pseudogemmobacter faecipullorum]
MNFSAWAIRNPVAPLLAFFLLMVLGWQSFNALPITRFPNIDVPLVSVTVPQAGAAPSELEAQVTKEIEDAVAGITGVKNVTSTVTDGLSTTLVEFRIEIPTDTAVQDTKDAIDRILADLPADAETPIVTRVDVEGQAIVTYAVSSPGRTLQELSWFVDDTLTRALQGRPGIGRVDRYGGVQREIRISLDPVRLGSYGITAAQVSQQLALTNADIGSGKAELGSGEQSIRTLGNQQTVGQLARTTIALPGGRHVRLGDLGEVQDSYEEPQSFARKDGQPVVMMAVFRSKGASEVSVSETVDAALAAVKARHPDVSLQLVDDQVYFTRGNYEAALHTLIEGSILAVLVVMAFLRNARATFIAAVALPLSAVPTFLIMDLLGFSLNLVSFLALTLATGILVDDAIVEVENIARHIRMGKTPYRAAIDAADEIGLAVIATSATIVAVFVPVSFMPGVPGQYFMQFGVTVAVAVLFSLLVARLITPMMAAYLMRSKDALGHSDSHQDGPLMRGYLWLVRHSTAMPVIRGRSVPAYYLTLIGAVGVVILSVIAMSKIPGNLFPPDDESRIAISVELPPGSRLAETDRVTEAMRLAIADIPGINHVLVTGGTSPLGDRELRRASMTLILERRDVSLTRKLAELAAKLPLIGPALPLPESKTRTVPQQEIEAEVFARLAQLPDLRAYKLGGPGGPGGRPVSYDVLSENDADLARAVALIEHALASEPLLENVSTQSTLPRPEVQITPRLDEAARLGVTTQAIAATLRIATIGDLDAALARLSLDNRLIPVRVRLNDAARGDPERIRALKVPTASGALVPLSAVADLTLAEGPAQIKRLNRQRVATIGADLPVGVALDNATARFEAVVAGLDLPESVVVKPSGDAELQAELLTSFSNAMIMGLMLVLSVLILLFKSVIQPVTIIASLLLSVGGVAIALIVTGNAMSMPVLIGILMLMGIVSKNAILLIDFAIEMRRRGLGRIEAVVEAGHKRAQPIIMTSIAMSAGMLPSALGVGEGGSFRAPMAIAVTGGIIVSTVLSLVIVPAFYLAMDDLSRLMAWITAPLIGPRDPGTEALAPEVLTEKLAATETELAALRARLQSLEARG